MEINESTFDGVSNFLARRWHHFTAHWFGYLAWISIIFLVTTCSIKIEHAGPYAHLYSDGDIVCMKLNEQRTQVIDTMNYDSRIEVRYAASIVVVDDGVSTTTQGYKKMWVHEYEVKRCE